MVRFGSQQSCTFSLPLRFLFFCFLLLKLLFTIYKEIAANEQGVHVTGGIYVEV